MQCMQCMSSSNVLSVARVVHLIVRQVNIITLSRTNAMHVQPGWNSLKLDVANRTKCSSQVKRHRQEHHAILVMLGVWAVQLVYPNQVWLVATKQT